MKKTIILMLLFNCLIACSQYAAVPYTNDPYQKLQYSFELIDLGRPVPAEGLAKEAMEKFQSEGDIFGEAEAYLVLGNLYKSNAYRTHYPRNENYDPTSKKSIDSFQQCMNLFEEIGDHMGVAKCAFAQGNAYGLDGKTTEQCEMFEKSSIAYQQGREAKTGQQSFEVVNANYKDFNEMIEAYKKAHGCTSDN